MPDSASSPLRVFLCHASQDKPIVRELYQRLYSEGWINPWLDEESLLLGQDWDMKIQKELDAADAVIVFVSNAAIGKEGYIQKELRLVYDESLTKPEEIIFIIPLRLEDCQPPWRFRLWHWGDYFGEKKEATYQSLLHSLKKCYHQKFGHAPESSTQPRYVPSKIFELGVREKLISRGIKIYTWNTVEFVKVPTGKFLMGSNDKDEYALDDEKPQHIVDIPYDYYIGRFPITNRQYIGYVNARRIKYSIERLRLKPHHPVVNVSWDDAQRYCRWLNELLKDVLPSGMIVRLPTEPEWEKAARGLRGNIYPWGDSFYEDKCNTVEGAQGELTPVDQYSPQGDSPFGCADMSGNAWEWTHSLFHKYPYQAWSERENEPGSRVLRGGSFGLDGRSARCACRVVIPPSSLFIICGFRVVIGPPVR